MTQAQRGSLAPAVLRMVLDQPPVRPEALARGRSVASGRHDRSREVAATLVECLVGRRLP
jgi:hypothetical protein